MNDDEPVLSAASLSARGAAAFVDAVLLAVPAAGLLAGVAAAGLGALAADALSVLGLVALTAAYAAVSMGRPGARNGQTVGKAALAIRVVRQDGGAVGRSFAAVRDGVMKAGVLGVLFTMVPFGWVAALAWLLSLTDGSGRLGHDRLAGSRVVQA